MFHNAWFSNIRRLWPQTIQPKMSEIMFIGYKNTIIFYAHKNKIFKITWMCRNFNLVIMKVQEMNEFLTFEILFVI